MGQADIVAFNNNPFRHKGGGFYIQVACRPLIRACLTFSGQADFLSQGQALGDFDLNGLGNPSLAYGNGFFGAIDQFIKGQGNFIFKVLAPNRGLVAASAAPSAARVSGKGIGSHA